MSTGRAFGLAGRLRAATAASLGGCARAELLFSGGLDSTVVAVACPEEVDLTLVTVGTAGSPDVRAAVSAAAELRRPHRVRTLAPADVETTVATLAGELDSASPPFRSALTALSLAIDATSPGRVLCGQGADELFFGYAHFRGLSVDSAAVRGESDLTRLLDHDWPQTDRIARARGREIRSPYVEEEFLRWCRAIPASERFAGEAPKALLRAAALELGVPAEVAARPKRAIQFGSGVARSIAARPMPTRSA